MKPSKSNANYKRHDRVAHVLQRELTRIIPRQIKDPRMPALVTIADVSVSADLSVAKIYLTVMGKLEDRDLVIEILTTASPYIRSLLNKAIRLRMVPELRFIYDETMEKGNHLTGLIDEAMQRTSESSEEEE